MWTPKQLLNANVVLTLRRSQLFTDDLIEFLGWSRGRAEAINRSRNPIKAAITMLRDTEDNEKTHEWLRRFYDRKFDSMLPATADTMHKALLLSKDFEKLMQDFVTPEEAWAKETDVQQDKLDHE